VRHEQSRITVSQPDQPMPLVLPQSNTTGSVIRIPVEPRTVGDHIRKRRLSLRMHQKDVVHQIGVDNARVCNSRRRTRRSRNCATCRL
jgi:hypothetical protein